MTWKQLATSAFLPLTEQGQSQHLNNGRALPQHPAQVSFVCRQLTLVLRSAVGGLDGGQAPSCIGLHHNALNPFLSGLGTPSAKTAGEALADAATTPLAQIKV